MAIEDVTANIDLLPRPFCGSSTVTATEEEVSCWNCGAATRSGMTKPENIAAWNTRTPDPLHQRLGEQAVAAILAGEVALVPLRLETCAANIVSLLYESEESQYLTTIGQVRLDKPDNSTPA